MIIIFVQHKSITWPSLESTVHNVDAFRRVSEHGSGRGSRELMARDNNNVSGGDGVLIAKSSSDARGLVLLGSGAEKRTRLLSSAVSAQHMIIVYLCR